jgi:thiamine-phosphate pyrophosphorylase
VHTIKSYRIIYKDFYNLYHGGSVKHIGKLHVLTDTQLQKRFSHVELAQMAIQGGADAIQLRQKHGSTREMVETACHMKDLCSTAGVKLIINDRIDIAIASNADGVHLGQDDFPIPLARRLLGDERIIGGSAGNIEEAMKCVNEGVDYIGFGPVYQTLSKDDAGPAKGIAVMKQLIKRVSCPVIAIGGVNTGNVQEIIRAGAYGIAVISAVCCMEDPITATRELVEVLNRGSEVG